MNCEQYQDSVASLLEIGPDPALVAEALAHEAACASCRRVREELTQVRDRLAAAAAEPLAEEVMRRVGSGRQSRPPRRRAWRWAVPLALAAGVAGAVLMTWSPGGTARAATLASMVQRVREVGSVAFTVNGPIDCWGHDSIRFVIVRGEKQRAELSSGRVIITDLLAHRAMVLRPQERWAIVSETREGLWNPYPALVSLADQPGEDLGTEMYDGEPARVIRTAVPQELGQEGRMTVWISIRTGLPLKLSVPRGDRSPGQFIEFTDFAFDAEYDPADFSLDVPPGYEARPPMDDPEVALKNASIQARNIFMAVAIYQQKHGEWPARLDQLVQSAVLDAGGLENPRLPELDQGFLYFPPTVDFDPQAGVLFEPIAEWRGVGVIAYADGHVEVQADRARYNELLLAAMARGQPGNGPR